LQEAILDPDDLSLAIYRDLLRLRAELREKLAEYIDKFSYQVLCNIDRDMNLDGSTIATHVYESEVFKSQLWTQRDIPQPQLSAKERAREETKHTEVEFTLLDTTLILPPTVKCFRAALRGLWLNYDHYSDSCHSFFMPLPITRVLNLRQSTKIEWRKRKELLEKALAEKKAQSEAALFDTMETPSAPTVIDVDKLYANYETEQNKLEKRRKGPEGLKLISMDVNLRSHRIVGGIYCIDYLDQPKQDVKIGSKSFLTTLLHPNKLKRKHFYQSYKPPPPPLPGVRRLPEEIEAEIKLMEQNLDKLALITVKLPENVLWFEPPIVCRWECPADVEESLLEDNETLESLPQASEQPDQSARRKVRSEPRVTEIRDFNLLFIPPRIDLYALMLDFVVPRLPDGYGVKIENAPGERKGSLMKYAIQESAVKEARRKQSTAINSVIHQTNSPRSLHPKVRLRGTLKILTRKSSQDITSSSQSSSSTPSPSTDEDEEVKCAQKFRRCSVSLGSSGKYMLSQFIRDLDQLIDLQTPQLTVKIDEIASNLSSPQEAEIPEVTRKPSSVSLLREDRDLLRDPRFLSASFKREDTPEKDVEIIEEEESESDSNEEDTQGKASSYPPDKSLSKWSTRDVHDVKFNEDKLTIQFRTGRLGCFGFAANRYSNLPYQTWELKPDFKIPNAVTFTLTAAVVSIDMTILEDGVRLNSLQGCSSTPLAHVLGAVFPLSELKVIMKSTAIDLFPESDAFCYTEGSCEKNSVMETHLYDCMGALALTHNFSWSRWNLLSGSRSAVLLMREVIEHRKPPNQSTLLVTPLKTIVVDCTEVSASFSTAGVPGMQYYADLHHLAREHSQPVSREKQRNMNHLLRDNVVQVLKSSRPLIAEENLGTAQVVVEQIKLFPEPVQRIEVVNLIEKLQNIRQSHDESIICEQGILSVLLSHAILHAKHVFNEVDPADVHVADKRPSLVANSLSVRLSRSSPVGRKALAIEQIRVEIQSQSRFNLGAQSIDHFSCEGFHYSLCELLLACEFYRLHFVHCSCTLVHTVKCGQNSLMIHTIVKILLQITSKQRLMPEEKRRVAHAIQSLLEIYNDGQSGQDSRQFLHILDIEARRIGLKHTQSNFRDGYSRPRGRPIETPLSDLERRQGVQCLLIIVVTGESLSRCIHQIHTLILKVLNYTIHTLNNEAAELQEHFSYGNEEFQKFTNAHQRGFLHWQLYNHMQICHTLYQMAHLTSQSHTSRKEIGSGAEKNLSNFTSITDKFLLTLQESGCVPSNEYFGTPHDIADESDATELVANLQQLFEALLIEITEESRCSALSTSLPWNNSSNSPIICINPFMSVAENSLNCWAFTQTVVICFLYGPQNCFRRNPAKISSKILALPQFRMSNANVSIKLEGSEIQSYLESFNKEIDSTAGPSSVPVSETETITIIRGEEAESGGEDEDDTGTYFIDSSGNYYYQATKESEPVLTSPPDFLTDDEEKEKGGKQKDASGNPDYVIMPSDGNSGEVSYVLIMNGQEGKNQASTGASGEGDSGENVEEDDEFEAGEDGNVYDFEEDPDKLIGMSDTEDDKQKVMKIISKNQMQTVSHLCNYCNYTSTKRYLLSRHMKSHSDERPHKCSVCERGFKTVASLHNHVNTHTGTKPHHCKFCMSSFTTSGELVRHVRYRHTHEKPHKCSECDYASVELSKLKRHIRCHTGERPYQCPHCTYASPDTFKLKRHLRIHTGEKPYECDVCNAKFTQSNSLKAHKLIHNVGDKPVFQCELCPTTCGRKTDLRIHIQKLHTSDKPLKCKRCDGLFPDRYTYKIHTKTHEGEKCYKCDLCPYASISARHLESHMLIHTDQKPYQCEQCEQSFRQKQLLKRHINLYHNPDYVPPVPKPKGHHCPHCNRSFRHKGNLIRHLALHDPESSVHEDAQALKLGRKKRILYPDGGEFKSEQMDTDEEEELEDEEDEIEQDELIEEAEETGGEDQKETLMVEGEDDNQYVVLEVIQMPEEDEEGQGSRLNEEFLLSDHIEEEVLQGISDPNKKLTLKTEDDEEDKDMKDCFGFDEVEEETVVRNVPARKSKRISNIAKE
ncbi:uncharacterized protein LOC132259176, partial [Phlebotomus argentipes]|uniref:uncharacterized protein LOC132259176 n=1 Tax=Phlebotomus argentipes TaxID=94469 RepID=UPI002892B8CD